MGHPNLSDAINKALEQSERDGGLKVEDILPGLTAQVQTKNTLYLIHRNADGKLFIRGSAKYCPEPVEVSISGSTWGGSLLKIGFIGIGMRMEFTTTNHRVPVSTSAVQSITFQGVTE